MTALNALLEENESQQGGRIMGVAIAIVTQNQDPEGLARVKLRFPWHNDENESDWARISVVMAGSERGQVFLPEVGDEVLVAFERGDMHFPYVLGALWNGQAKPPEANSDGNNDIRMLKTRKGHILKFDDNDSKGQIELALNDGKKIHIDDDGIKIDDGGGNSITIDSKGGSISVEAASKLSLKAPSIAIESSGTMNIKSGGTLTIKGSLVQIN